MPNRALLRLALALACTPFACAADDGEDDGGGPGGKADDLNEGGMCAGKIIDKTVGDDGEGVIDLEGRTDILASLVFKAEGSADDCPESFAEILAKLREVDKEGCAEAQDGMRTAVVSETSQVLGKADTYRTVTTRECGGRQAHELLFSMFGLRSSTTELPDDVEIMAFDRTNKSYAFYAIEGGELHFFGTSVEMIKQDGAGRCVNCHPAGGVNMKELQAPWVHWEGDTTTPGADKLVDANDDLGSKTDGIELESIVDSGNAEVVELRAKTLLATNDLKQVLRPLFCTMQINIEEGNSSPGGGAPSSIPGAALVDSRLGFGSVPVSTSIYGTAIKNAKQKIIGNSGTQLKNKSGKLVVDTHFAFAYPVVSREDQTYIDKLKELNVIDDDFVLDVLAVDMTRPLFSQDRCALLDSAPTIAKLTTTTGKAVKDLPKKIREGFATNLAASDEGSAGAQLAASLAVVDDAAAHSKAVDDFFAACTARTKSAFMADALKAVSSRRDQARELPIMEFPATLPMDSLKVGPEKVLNPTTCVLE
ncbi:MAG TPA: hypothetical protein VG755_35815 [Nannocystaceae bacterium]|nr:hypothetical protein [Nannocystaceae bacterium]